MDSYCAWMDSLHDNQMSIQTGANQNMGVQRQSNPVLPAVILALFFGVLVYLIATRKHEAATSHPQSTTELASLSMRPIFVFPS